MKNNSMDVSCKRKICVSALVLHLYLYLERRSTNKTLTCILQNVALLLFIAAKYEEKNSSVHYLDEKIRKTRTVPTVFRSGLRKPGR